MKSIILFIVALVTGSLAFETNLDLHSADTAAAVKTQSLKIWLPKKAKIKEVSDGIYVSSRKHVYLAEINGKIKIFNSAKINCKCDGGGCSPVSSGGGLGCALDDCTSCTGTISGVGGVGEPGQTVTPYSAGFVNKSFKASFASQSDLKNYNMGFEAMFSYGKIKKEMGAFIEKHGGSKGKTVKTAVNIADRIVVVDLERSRVLEAGGIVLSAVSCGCDSGSGGCKYGWKVGAQYCTAGECTDCGLSAVVGGGIEIPVTQTPY